MINCLNKITINAKVAIGVTIAEKLFKLLDKDRLSEEYEMARAAMDDCWNWLRGDEIEAGTIYEHMATDDGYNILTIAMCKKDRIGIDVWFTVVEAVAYIVVQAFRRDYESCAPAECDNIDDNTYSEYIESLVTDGYIKSEVLEDIKDYLIENYPIDKGLEDKGITKEEMMKLVD